MGSQRAGELLTRELTALIGVENLRCTVFAKRLGERGQAKTGLQRIRQTPREHLAAVAVDHRDQIGKTVLQTNVGDIGGPDLVGAADEKASQQIRKRGQIYFS